MNHLKADISVIICVYNGGELFKKNIESVSRLKIPEDTRVEFLFVDNNSTDGSAEIIREYARKCPNTFCYLFESKPGLSYARNLGIKKAKNEIIAFTDADTILPENWLLRIKEGFSGYDCAALGGRILPVWEVKPPAWLQKNLDAGKSYFNICLSKKAGYYHRDTPDGSNNAVKKECFQKYGGFRTDLGRRPGLPLGGEDVEFFKRIIHRGEKVFYYPPMTVYHQIPKERIMVDKRRYVQNNFITSILGLHTGTKNPSALKTLPVLPEIIFKLTLTSLCPGRFAALKTAACYQSRLYSFLYTLIYEIAGEKNTIRIAMVLRLIDENQRNRLLEFLDNNKKNQRFRPVQIGEKIDKKYKNLI